MEMLPEGLRFTRQSERGVRFGSHSAACPRPALAPQAETSSFRSLMQWRAFSPKPDIRSSPGPSANAAELPFGAAEFHGNWYCWALGNGSAPAAAEACGLSHFPCFFAGETELCRKSEGAEDLEIVVSPWAGLEFGTGHVGGHSEMAVAPTYTALSHPWPGVRLHSDFLAPLPSAVLGLLMKVCVPSPTTAPRGLPAAGGHGQHSREVKGHRELPREKAQP